MHSLDASVPDSRDDRAESLSPCGFSGAQLPWLKRAGMAAQVVARNGCAAAVSVVSRDAGLLQRGHEVRTRGVNLVVADFFDAGARIDSLSSGCCPSIGDTLLQRLGPDGLRIGTLPRSTAPWPLGVPSRYLVPLCRSSPSPTSLQSLGHGSCHHVHAPTGSLPCSLC